MRQFLAFVFASLLFPALTLAADGEARFESISLGTMFADAGTQSTFQVASSTDAIEQIYTVKESATVVGVCYAMALRTGTPPTYKIGIEGVSATTGRADTTYKTGTGECSATFTPPATTAQNDTIQCVTLTGTTCAVTVGQKIALTIRYSSGTINTSNASTFYTKFASQMLYTMNEQNYLYTVAAGVGTKSSGYDHFAMFYKSSTRYYGNAAISYHQDNYSGTAEKGMQFSRPGPTGQTYKVAGFEFCHQGLTAGDTVVGKLYNGTTAMGTHTEDTDYMGLDSPACDSIYFDEGPQTLTFNTAYNIGVTFTTNSKRILTTDVYNSAYMDAWPWGTNAFGIHRATQGATAWTTDPTLRPAIRLIMDSIVAASGGSGGVMRQADMNGGMAN